MPRRRGTSLAALVCLLTAALAGCRRPEPLVAISGPRDFESFEVRTAGGEVLWRVEAAEPRALSEVVYGHVPAGFEQSTPGGGEAPRDFAIGEEIVAESVTLRRIFRHEAWADGPKTLSIYTRGMELRAQPADPAGSHDGQVAPLDE